MIGSAFWEQTILIDSTFCEIHDWQHLLAKNMIFSAFLKKPRLSAQSGVKIT
jgi:hypothetical protein